MDATPKSPPVGALVLTIAAFLLYLIMVSDAVQAPYLESIDQGLAAIYALVAYVLLWLVLAALLALAAAKGEMPGWAALGALLLHVLAGAGVFAAFATGINSRATGPVWVLAVPVLTPPLTACYALWARFRGIPTSAAGKGGSALVGSLIAILSLVPIGIAVSHEIEIERHKNDPVPVVDREKEQEAWHRAYVARFEKLGPESPLNDYLEYLTPGSDLRVAAVAKARLIRTRQADAEALLKGGMGVWLERLWQLDLQATPALCGAMSAYLLDQAEHYRVKYDYNAIDDYIGIHLNNMKWMVNEHCNLRDALAAVEEAAGSYPSSPPRDGFVAAVARLQERD
jgi:hypothetical protein